MNRPALVIGSTLLALVGLWVAVLLPPTHPDGRRASFRVAGTSFPTVDATPMPVAGPAAPASPAAGTGPHRSAHRSASPVPRASKQTRAQAVARATATGSGAVASTTTAVGQPTPTPTATRAPLPRPTATVASYVFAPRASTSGPAPTAEMRFSDLSLHSGQQVVGAFTMSAPGAIEFDAHTASSSAPSGSYPTSALLACVEFIGQSPCQPVATPQPGYWTVTAADLAHHTQYRLRVLASADSGLLAGIYLGWRGPQYLQVAGFRLPGGCQVSVGNGYAPGCGLKYKILTSGPAAFTAATATTGLEISLKNTVSNAKAYSGPLNSPQHIQVPAAGDWSGHVYPADGAPVADLILTMDWH